MWRPPRSTHGGSTSAKTFVITGGAALWMVQVTVRASVIPSRRFSSSVAGRPGGSRGTAYGPVAAPSRPSTGREQERLYPHILQTRNRPHAVLVCSVERTRCPVSEAWTGFLRFRYRGFHRPSPHPGPDQNRAQATGKGHADAGVDLCLPIPSIMYSMGSSTVRMLRECCSAPAIRRTAWCFCRNPSARHQKDAVRFVQ